MDIGLDFKHKNCWSGRFLEIGLNLLAVFPIGLYNLIKNKFCLKFVCNTGLM